MNGSLPSMILQDINLLLGIMPANVKKINANGWSLNQPGTGILNARLDFDNGASSNLLICNSGHVEELKATLYYKSEMVLIDFIDHSIKISIKDYDNNLKDTFNYTLTHKDSLLYEIKDFHLSIQNPLSASYLADNKYKSIRVSHLVQEKINHLTSFPIFYS